MHLHAYNILLQIRASALRASSISLTTDSVLAHTGESYVGVTGHSPVVGRCSWKLVSTVLAVKVDNQSHTAENIAALLKDCVNVKYQLRTRLDSITTDNGANFKAAVNQLLEENVAEEDPSCACHTFSLVVKNAINPKAGGSLTTDLVQLFRTITEKYPTLCSISRLITTLNSAYANAGPPSSWNLEVQNWNHLPSEVYNATYC